jgi:hypothetical protein
MTEPEGTQGPPGCCDTFCMGEGEGHGHLIITRPRFVQYVVRARERGMRRFNIVARTTSERHAYELLAEALRTGMGGSYFRGDVLGDEGPESYYEPMVLVEMKR